MEKQFLLWSVDKHAWWRPGGWGYTVSIVNAGIFEEQDAIERAGRGVPPAHLGSIAIPLAEVDAAAVDVARRYTPADVPTPTNAAAPNKRRRSTPHNSEDGP